MLHHKNIILAILTVIMLLSCINENALHESAIMLKEPPDDQRNVAVPGADTLMIIFLNNPYHLTDNDSISLRLNDRLVYKKSFRERDTVCLDIARAGGGNYRPDMVIRHNGHYYELSGKRNVYIGEGDKILYLVFCPTNNRNENFFIFSQKDPIL